MYMFSRYELVSMKDNLASTMQYLKDQDTYASWTLYHMLVDDMQKLEDALQALDSEQ